jgi:hypothetical protein
LEGNLPCHSNAVSRRGGCGSACRKCRGVASQVIGGCGLQRGAAGGGDLFAPDAVVENAIVCIDAVVINHFGLGISRVCLMAVNRMVSHLMIREMIV